MPDPRTLPALFAARVAQSPQAEAYREYDERRGAWIGSSFGEVNARVTRVRAALARLALPVGARIAILLPNGLHAVYVDQAALALGCVPVPMHALDNAESIAYIVADSDAAVLVATTDTQWQAIARTGTAFPALREVVVLQREHAAEPWDGEGLLVQFEDWLARAVAAESAPVDVPAQVPQPQDLAAIVYTSGTTGKPKGVMLTHANVVSNVEAAMRRMTPAASDVFLSFLPLSHTFERTAGYYLPIAAGCCVVFARSTRQLPEDLKSVRPTILISVPRIYERVFAALQVAVAGSALRSTLFELAQAIGWRRFRRAQQLFLDSRWPALLDALAWPLLDRLVAQKLRAQFGGRLRLAVSGGAALSNAVARCFLGLGVPIVQGYGMTEASPIVAANGIEDNDPATVGRALPGVETRIGENQELLVRGPNVMRGYWKRDEDTTAAFIDGWLRTGDQAAIEDGRIRILGRVKEIIVTSTGEKIAPVDVELAITADRSFESAYAYGDDRPFIGCAVVLARSYWEQLAARLRLDPKAPGSVQSPAAAEVVLRRVRELTRGLPYYAQPRAVVLSLEPWTVGNSLMTPTLKLKRKNLAAHYAPDLERIYASASRASQVPA